MPAPKGEHSWRDYYRKVANRPPRELLVQVVERFPAPGLAIDLGCGGGIETFALLRRGWQVVAVDREPVALEYITSRVRPHERDRLTM